MKKYILILGLLLASCQRSPYPDVPLYPVETPTGDPLPAGYSLVLTPVMEFHEGVEQSYALAFKVPASGTGQIAITGLPAGANYDAENALLSWTPPVGSGKDPANPEFSYRSYMLSLTLTDSGRPDLKLNRQAVLLVYQGGSP